MKFHTSFNIQVAMETKMRRKTKQACVQLSKVALMLHILYKLMSANLCLLVILFHKLRYFFQCCYCVTTLVAMDTGYRNSLTFLFSFLHSLHNALVYVPNTETLNSTFAERIQS